MNKVIMSPSKYAQGEGQLSQLQDYVVKYGDAALVLMSGTAFRTISDEMKANFEAAGIKFFGQHFGGECSKNEIAKQKKFVEDNGINVVVGVGGGKTLDTAKAVAYHCGTPVVIVPTIASTDAPCSALSVLYTDEGVFDEYLVLPKNPELVLMDTDVIKNAPARLFVAGIGDALATYYEAIATKESGATTMSGGHPTNSAIALAELCLETLLSDGLKAKVAVENNVCTKAVENVIEANTYLSGVGFESGGLAAAHAIHNGMTVMEELHNLHHGEKVAFGTLTQLVLENRDMEEIVEIIAFCKDLGLPTNFEELGIKEVNNDKLMEVAKAATVEGETIHNMPFDVTAEDVYAAMLATDALSKEIG